MVNFMAFFSVTYIFKTQRGRLVFFQYVTQESLRLAANKREAGPTEVTKPIRCPYTYLVCTLPAGFNDSVRFP
jgi:hypothetical protein